MSTARMRRRSSSSTIRTIGWTCAVIEANANDGSRIKVMGGAFVMRADRELAHATVKAAPCLALLTEAASLTLLEQLEYAPSIEGSVQYSSCYSVNLWHMKASRCSEGNESVAIRHKRRNVERYPYRLPVSRRSPFNQPSHSPDFIGSGKSHLTHCNLRVLVPLVSINLSGSRQIGQVSTAS